jgi:hypothetical protein
VALGDSQPLWLGYWLLAKAKAGKSQTKVTRKRAATISVNRQEEFVIF